MYRDVYRAILGIMSERVSVISELPVTRAQSERAALNVMRISSTKSRLFFNLGASGVRTVIRRFRRPCSACLAPRVAFNPDAEPQESCGYHEYGNRSWFHGFLPFLQTDLSGCMLTSTAMRRFAPTSSQDWAHRD